MPKEGERVMDRMAHPTSTIGIGVPEIMETWYKIVHEDTLPKIAQGAMTLILAFVASVPSAVWLLGIFTLLDLAFAIAEHYVTRDICSREAKSGAVRKLMMLVFAYFVAAMEVRMGLGVGIGRIFCSYLTVLEFISIAEHYAMVGLPMPEPLLKVLVNVRDLAPRTASRQEIIEAFHKKDAGKSEAKADSKTLAAKAQQQ